MCLVLPSFQPGLEGSHPRVVISEALGSHNSSLRPQFVSRHFILLHNNICEGKEDTSLPQTLFRFCDMSGSIMIITRRIDNLTPRSRQQSYFCYRVNSVLWRMVSSAEGLQNSDMSALKADKGENA